MWGRGLITFGDPTSEQIAYMQTLTATTDLHDFLAGFPTDYIDAGFQHDSYGDMEYGAGVRDFVLNPFGVPDDPDSSASNGTVYYDINQARSYAYVTWAGEVYDGRSNEYDDIENVPIGPGGENSVQFSDEGSSWAARAARSTSAKWTWPSAVASFTSATSTSAR